VVGLPPFFRKEKPMIFVLGLINVIFLLVLIKIGKMRHREMFEAVRYFYDSLESIRSLNEDIQKETRIVLMNTKDVLEKKGVSREELKKTGRNVYRTWNRYVSPLNRISCITYKDHVKLFR
jgi:hypothetical protein